MVDWSRLYSATLMTGQFIFNPIIGTLQNTQLLMGKISPVYDYQPPTTFMESFTPFYRDNTFTGGIVPEGEVTFPTTTPYNKAYDYGVETHDRVSNVITQAKETITNKILPAGLGAAAVVVGILILYLVVKK